MCHMRYDKCHMSHIISTRIDNHISVILQQQNKIDREEHISSGKLSASMLGKPLQEQILKIKGVPQKEVDEYTLRKFQRGKDVEGWLIKSIPNLVETQKPVEYRNVVGLVDAVVDASTWEQNFGIMPLECKSVTNAKFKNIQRSGLADRGHILQASLYALGMMTEYFAVTYIASDDYRILTMVYRVADYKAEVDQIIDRFQHQLELDLIPVFEAIEAWQKNPMYASYPEFIGLTEEEANLKFKTEYEKK